MTTTPLLSNPKENSFGNPLSTAKCRVSLLCITCKSNKHIDEEGMCSHVYKDLMNREITEEDYDLLLKLDEKVDMKLEVYLFKVCKMQMNAGLVSVPPSSGICVHCDHPLPVYSLLYII